MIKNNFLRFLKGLERWEYSNPKSFWACVITGYFGFTVLFNPALSFSENSFKSQTIIEKVRAGGQKEPEVISSENNLAKKKYFKEMQFKHFPDFESRVSMEKRQAIIYQKAVKKIKECQRLFPFLNKSQILTESQKWITAEEKSAMNYFHGTGIYAKFQDPKTPPNVFDTRKTFLKKMENRDMRKKFLETYNRVNSIE